MAEDRRCRTDSKAEEGSGALEVFIIQLCTEEPLHWHSYFPVPNFAAFYESPYVTAFGGIFVSDEFAVETTLCKHIILKYCRCC